LRAKKKRASNAEAVQLIKMKQQLTQKDQIIEKLQAQLMKVVLEKQEQEARFAQALAGTKEALLRENRTFLEYFNTRNIRSIETHMDTLASTFTPQSSPPPTESLTSPAASGYILPSSCAVVLAPPPPPCKAPPKSDCNCSSCKKNL